MSYSYVIIVVIVSYILKAFAKLKWDNIPVKYVPLGNVIIGFASALICYFTKIESSLLDAITLCLVATMGSDGISSIYNSIQKDSEEIKNEILKNNVDINKNNQNPNSQDNK